VTGPTGDAWWDEDPVADPVVEARRTRAPWRPARIAGVVGLVVASLLGLPAGWPGAVIVASLYVAFTALYALVRRRSWLGSPMGRGVSAGVLAGSVVALVVTASVAAPPTDDAAAPSSAPATRSPTPTVTPTPTPTPTPSPTDEVAATPAQVPSSAPGPQTALATAMLLPVKGRAPRTGYDRDLYGQAWKDVDRNGCDTRNDILRRDLAPQVIKDGTNGCVVASGTLQDPYSGTTIAFVRGPESSAVQIDHVVALSDSWQKGAQQWDTATREAFANDPLNLLAVDGPLNQQKGDGDTATWLPPNKAYRCTYVARQVGVKAAYGLWVTQAEQDAMVRVLSACPTEPLPTGAAVPPLGDADGSAAVVVPAPGPGAEAPVVAPPAAVVGPFASCTEAWAAGAAPVRAGDPGYAAKLDRDGDGIGCEKRP